MTLANGCQHCEIERLRAALGQVKARVCGDAFPNWENTPNTTFSRSYIADVCDLALSGDSSADVLRTDDDPLKPPAIETQPASNEDTVAELEAAAAKWVLEKNKYTLECLRDARKAVLARMLSGDPSQVETKPKPTQTFVYAGNVYEYDQNGDPIIDWDNEHHEPKIGTMLFLHLWTQDAIDEARAAGEELHQGLSQETKPKPTIEGLERLLQAEDSKQVYVWPDGYVHDTPPPEKAPEAHIDYNVPGCDCLGCELAPKASTDEVLREGKCANCGKSWVVKGDPAAVVSVLAVHCTCGHINK